MGARVPSMANADFRRPSFFRDPVFRRLLGYVLQHRPTLAVAVAAMAVSAAADALLARLTGQLVDVGLIERNVDAGIWLPLAFVGVIAFRGAAGFASSILLNRISQAVLLLLREKMFDKVLGWPQSAFENTPSGVLTSKFVNEASNALNAAAEVLSTAVRDSLTVVALLGVLLYFNWQLTLLALVVAPLIAFALRAFSRRLRHLAAGSQAMLGELTRAVQEAHEGSRVIKVYGGFGYETERFGAINNKLRRFAMKMEGGCLRGTVIHVDYRLIDLGDGSTRLDYACFAETKGWMRIFGPLFALFGRMQAKSFFKQLKALAEAERLAGAAT